MRLAAEKEIRMQLSEIQAMCRRREDEIEQAGVKIGDWSEYYNLTMMKRMNVAELAIVDRHVQNLYRFREQLRLGLEVLYRKRDDMMAQYREAKREVKILEHVKEKKWQAYRSEFTREEDREADEMATLKYARERVEA